MSDPTTPPTDSRLEATDSAESGYAPDGPAPDLIGRIETHGIDVIPESERHGVPSDLFHFWMGSNIIFTYMLFGGILIQLGLPLVAALILAVFGNLAWFFVGVLGIGGPRSGTASMVISRAQYGYHGNKISCFLNWVVNVGYEGVDFAIAALAAFSLVQYYGWNPNTLGKAVILFVIIAGSFALGLYGHATIFWFQKWAAWTLGIASILLLVFVVPHVNFSYTYTPALHGSALTVAILIGFSVVLSGPFSYPNSADYSRYLPSDASPKKVIFHAAMGGYIPTVFLTVVGILAATVVDASDFTSSIAKIIPHWFYPIFLIIVIVGVVCNSVISVYSSGLALQALGVRLARSRTVWIDVVVGTALAVYGVLIATNFLVVLENFLLWSIYWYTPFFGVYVAELILSRGFYDGHELFKLHGGRYWYDRGYRWKGVISLLVAMLLSALCSNTPYFRGPISTHLLGGGDLSAIGGFVVGFGMYWVLCVIPDRKTQNAGSRS